MKQRLLGHWGASPALSFVWAHLNRVIKRDDLDVIFIAGPGHGAPGVLGPAYLEGTYSEIYPDKSEDLDGLRKFFKQFSFPGHIGSHVTPETPGSIHEGGELGYSLSHAYGAALDNPDLIVACVVGDGEAETGPLATAWHSNKFINPVRDGAVLPILNLNGYKIANPTILARISHDELEALFVGYGYKPYFVEGSDPSDMHQAMAATLDAVVAEIRGDLERRRRGERPKAERPRWPMIVLRSPKGWTGPKEIRWPQGRRLLALAPGAVLRRSRRSAQPEAARELAAQLRAREAVRCGRDGCVPELQALAPAGPPAHERQSARQRRPAAQGPASCPDFRDYAVAVAQAGKVLHENTKPLGEFLRDVMRNNMTTFRVFGPDETASNRLQSIYEVSKKTWMAEMLPEDADGGELARDGRVMEMLSEHTLRRLARGLPADRPARLLPHLRGLRSRDRLDVQPARQVARHLQEPRAMARIGRVGEHPAVLDGLAAGPQRLLAPGPGLHRPRDQQEPERHARLPAARREHAARGRRPSACARPTASTSSSRTSRSTCSSPPSTRRSCTAPRGSASGAAASNDEGEEPDVVMASCGDVATQEALAATAILRERLPDLKVRFVNVVDLFKMQPASEHPHGSTAADFDSLFTRDKPIIFNFHGYPWLIHKLAYKFHNHDNLHVRGYKEKGNINTPLELAILNRHGPLHPGDRRDRPGPGAADRGRASQGGDEERHHRQPRLRAHARHRP